MELSAAAAGIAAAVGVLVGAGAMLAVRVSEQEQRGPREPRLPFFLPPGVSDVLAVLRSAAVVLDRENQVVRANAAAYVLGLVRGNTLVPARLRVLATQARREGDVQEAELQLSRGTLGSSNLAVTARAAALGRDFILLLVEDRTESLRVEAVRRDFVANVSHELKTPVGALRLLAEAVTAASDDPESVRRFAGRMQHEAERLSGLVQDIIDLSRLQGRDALEQPIPVDLDHVVHDAIDRCRLTAAAKEIRLVSAGTSGVQVLGDADLLTTALRNLVDNAVNYSPERTQVGVGVRPTGDVVEVSVTDQGIGIPERELERIFERFYRVDPARSRATGGTGLGLSIVKHVVANHGGELTVWSVEGAGSTFTMRLPVHAPLVSSCTTGTEPPPSGSFAGPHDAARRVAQGHGDPGLHASATPVIPAEGRPNLRSATRPGRRPDTRPDPRPDLRSAVRVPARDHAQQETAQVNPREATP